jgi:hypothetical protein
LLIAGATYGCFWNTSLNQICVQFACDVAHLFVGAQTVAQIDDCDEQLVMELERNLTLEPMHIRPGHLEREDGSECTKVKQAPGDLRLQHAAMKPRGEVSVESSAGGPFRLESRQNGIDGRSRVQRLDDLVQEPSNVKLLLSGKGRCSSPGEDIGR